MNHLIEKTNKMYRKTFTLIELIAVIVVIGILAAIVIPNISSFKEEAKLTAMVADGRNLQTAVDLYQLDYHGDFPTLKGEDSAKPVLGLPQSVDFNALYPAYIRDLPQAKEMYYWIDYQGQFYYSTIDNPNDFIQGDAGLTWTANERAKGYTIYEIESEINSSSKRVTLREVDALDSSVSSYLPEDYSINRTYFIKVIDEYDNETPPIKSGYAGIPPLEELDQISSPTHPEHEGLITSPLTKMIATGEEHTLVVESNGNLWSFGNNNYGQLGDYKTITTSVPTPKMIMTEVKTVAGGKDFTLVVKENGELWTFGDNRYGQLGHSTNNDTVAPNPVPKQIMTGVKSVAAGERHSLVLKENGELWSFGYNQFGQLGYTHEGGSQDPNPTPKQVTSDVKSVFAGSHFSLILKENGDLMSFGRNQYGQLGHSINSGVSSAANPEPTKILSGISTAAAANHHSLAVKTNGVVYSFGRNDYGQLGHSKNMNTLEPNHEPKQIMTGITSVTGGLTHSLATSGDGKLFSFGLNSYGQLGYVGVTMSAEPKEIMTNVKYASAGNRHSIAMKENDEVWAFGHNYSGQLGNTTNVGLNRANPYPKEIVLSTN